MKEKEQLSMLKTEEIPIRSCAFTGHRTLEEDLSARKLKAEIKKLIQRGVDTFYNGMAMGFDLLAAETVLKLKKEYPHIRLIACVPCYGQEKSFPEPDKKRYVHILKKADETTVLSDTYYRGCMLVRNRYMADRADVLIAYCKKKTGGAAFTVSYFSKKYPDKKIVLV